MIAQPKVYRQCGNKLYWMSQLYNYKKGFWVVTLASNAGNVDIGIAIAYGTE